MDYHVDTVIIGGGPAGTAFLQEYLKKIRPVTETIRHGRRLQELL